MILVGLEPYVRSRQELSAFAQGAPMIFDHLFIGGETRRPPLHLDVGPLRELGLVELDAGGWRPKVSISSRDGLFIVTDQISNIALDRVFPAYPDESYLLAAWPKIENGDVVLDLCTGSGIGAVYASRKGAAYVVATDITARSKEFVELNCHLNGCDNVEFLFSDLCSTVASLAPDVILCNPPFAPVADPAHYFIHSAGGPLGTALIERFLVEVGDLQRTACTYMVCLSLGGAAGWRIEELLGLNTPGDARLFPLYDGDTIDLDRYYASLPLDQQDLKWRSDLATRGYDRLGYFALAFGPDARAREAATLRWTVDRLMANPQVSLDRYCWSMTRRLDRYDAHHAA